MTHIKTIYKGSLRTEATHVKSGNKFITDAPTDNHGKGETFSPTDTVAAALASCMLTIMGIEANKLGIELGPIQVETEKIMRSNPRAISKLKLHFSWQECNLSPDHKEHIKQKALTCPVALSLHPDIRQEVTFDF